MILNWRPADADGVITAVGVKGIYEIRWADGYRLDGVGHDRIGMLALPRSFDTLNQAKDRAAALERVRTIESEASGSG